VRLSIQDDEVVVCASVCQDASLRVWHSLYMLYLWETANVKFEQLQRRYLAEQLSFHTIIRAEESTDALHHGRECASKQLKGRCR
jgi:hypothetical protein